jgi:PAS domain S-box-containing protein
MLRGEGLQLSLWLGLALTLAVFGAAVWVRLAFFPDQVGLVFITLYPAVVLCAIFFGSVSGALATLLGTVVGTLVFMQPFGSLALTSERVLAAALFSLSGALTCVLAHRLRHGANQLRQSEEHYRALFESTACGQLFLEPDSLRVLQCNAAASQGLGYSKQELCSMRLMEFSVDIDQKAEQAMQTRLLTNEAQTVDIKMRRKDGTLRDMTATIVALKTAAGLRFHATLMDITELRQVQAELRLAVIGFESGDGAVVMAPDGTILRANTSILKASGFTEHELLGQNASFVRSKRYPPAFFETVGRDLARCGSWRGDMWLKNKDGQEVMVWCTLTEVRDKQGKVTHLVGNYADATARNLQEQQRLRNEAAHRRSLVREVHHRIKNHLQGVMGILNRFSKKHPETEVQMRHAIAQVQSIAIIHGLQGQSYTSSVPLHAMLLAISRSVQELWQTTVLLETAPESMPYMVAEDESVPVALVLNELIMNAVKHGGQSAGRVNICLRQGAAADVAQIRITNAGHFQFNRDRTTHLHSGLDLIEALMPRSGGRVSREQRGDQVITLVEFEPPVVSMLAPEAAMQTPAAPALA